LSVLLYFSLICYLALFLKLLCLLLKNIKVLLFLLLSFHQFFVMTLWNGELKNGQVLYSNLISRAFWFFDKSKISKSYANKTQTRKSQSRIAS